MKTNHVGAACSFALSLTALMVNTVNAASISGQGTWESTLQGRDLDGNLSTFEAYYDTALNITWLADANHAKTSGFDADGLMYWTTANTWAANLNPYNSGITGWRLPTVTDTGVPGCDYSETGGTDCGYNVDTATSEMVHMFYSTLGNKGYYDTLGVAPQGYWGLTNSGAFSNIIAYNYWSATQQEYSPYTDSAWYFNTYYGFQTDYYKASSFNAWAVHASDVGASAAPVPAAAWLFGSGLLSLLGLSRCKA